MKKSFTSHLKKMDSNIWGIIIPVPKDVSSFYIEKDIKRYIITLNKTCKIHRAFLSAGNGNWFIYINQEVQKEIKTPIGEEVFVEVEPDVSEYGMPLPDELAEGFLVMPTADELFHKLTRGKQRTLIYLVAKPKRPETKAKKAIDILEYLEAVNGKLDFKELNEWFKARK